jgi:hypothetical protein
MALDVCRLLFERVVAPGDVDYPVVTSYANTRRSFKRPAAGESVAVS